MTAPKTAALMPGLVRRCGRMDNHSTRTHEDRSRTPSKGHNAGGGESSRLRNRPRISRICANPIIDFRDNWRNSRILVLSPLRFFSRQHYALRALHSAFESPVGRAIQVVVCKTIQVGVTPARDSIFCGGENSGSVRFFMVHLLGRIFAPLP